MTIKSERNQREQKGKRNKNKNIREKEVGDGI